MFKEKLDNYLSGKSTEKLDKHVDVYVKFLLDCSGSMESNGLIADVIGGFNGLIKKLSNDNDDLNKKNVIVSVSKFDHEYIDMLEMIPLSSVPELTENEYFARGNTALYDAIDRAVKEIDTVISACETKPTILFYIVTDGQNNASKMKKTDVVEIIKKREADGWNIEYLSTHLSAFGEGSNIGLSTTKTVQLGPNSDMKTVFSAQVMRSVVGASALSRGTRYESPDELDKMYSVATGRSLGAKDAYLANNAMLASDAVRTL